jgi:radical SAM protein with 4Fe4S-binding SPASM domain
MAFQERQFIGDDFRFYDQSLASLERPVTSADSDSEVGALAVGEEVTFAWLEITGKCQEKCIHCYADSSPQGTHGDMTENDWIRSIDQVQALGGRMVQFIGGEPTLHPSLPTLVSHSLEKSMEVEVYSNLTHVSDKMWQTLDQPGVSLATSYYSSRADEHDKITNLRGSHKKTRDNIVQALERGIPLRAGIIGVMEEQQVTAAHNELTDLGVEHIGVDYLRQVGRGIRDQKPNIDQLCGHCGDEKVAILATGDVQPCVFSRWGEFTVGNMQEQSLDEILRSYRAAKALSSLRGEFTSPTGCRPNCSPNCKPSAGDPCPPECVPNCLPSKGSGPPKKSATLPAMPPLPEPKRVRTSLNAQPRPIA